MLFLSLIFKWEILFSCIELLYNNPNPIRSLFSANQSFKEQTSYTEEKKIENKHEILFYRLKCQKANAHNLAKFCYP